MDPELLQCAFKATLAAGREILHYYSTGFSIERKEDKSPVTDADLAAHNQLTTFLNTTRIPVLSEEGAKVDFEIRKNWDRYWLVDPLDGTKEFINRNGEFTVNVALMVKDRPSAGIVFAPVSGELYAGIVNKGLYYVEDAFSLKGEWWLDLDEFMLDLTSQQKRLQEYTVAVSRSHMDQQTRSYLAVLGSEKGPVRTLAAGSSLKFCLVAHGKADEYPRFGPTMEWDTAAGHAVLLSAGKDIRTRSGESLVYNKRILVNEAFIAR